MPIELYHLLNVEMIIWVEETPRHSACPIESAFVFF
jgi:hypothetical protein